MKKWEINRMAVLKVVDEMSSKTQKLIFWLLAIPMIYLIVWGSIWFVERETKVKPKPYVRVETDLERTDKAKLPVKIYRGTYDGKKLEIREYHPVR